MYFTNLDVKSGIFKFFEQFIYSHYYHNYSKVHVKLADGYACYPTPSRSDNLFLSLLFSTIFPLPVVSAKILSKRKYNN